MSSAGLSGFQAPERRRLNQTADFTFQAYCDAKVSV